MALKDDVRAAIDKSLRKNPKTVTVPEDKLEEFAQLQSRCDELLQAARELEVEIERF